MKIVIIREEIIQPDITVEELISKWKELEAIPGAGRVQLQIMDTYPSMEELDELVEDADALFGVWITEGLMSEAFFKKHPKLKYIATLGHGYESFDYAMTRRYGVTVTNTVYGAQTIAEHAFALLMYTCHHIRMCRIRESGKSTGAIRRTHRNSARRSFRRSNYTGRRWASSDLGRSDLRLQRWQRDSACTSFPTAAP